MALRNIVLAGDDILRKRCREVSEIDDRVRQTLDDMIETMKSQNGAGIAAPQVGIMRRMFVVEGEDGEVVEVINPHVVQSSGSQFGEEGCLSFPGYVGTVERPEYIKIEALDRHGNSVVREGTELMAIALSHEMDHLDGILYIDKATDIHEAEPAPAEDAQDESAFVEYEAER
ncbi:MAG: peptide deformylase [Clostridiales bacterium]|nr:peptide deformylase [Clostridiales bacterium]